MNSTVLFGLAVFSVAVDGKGDSYRRSTKDQKTAISNSPYLLANSPKNLTTQCGSTAHLSCSKGNSANSSVTWIRNKDSHLLTVGTFTYIKDERFQIFNSQENDGWTLQIRNTRSEDNGFYECQLSTEPKISLVFHLSCTAPEVRILNGRELFVNHGSRVTLKCRITGYTERDPYIMWYKENRKLMNSSGSDQTWRTQSSIFVKMFSNRTSVGLLLLKEVTSEDAGNYTCQPYSGIQDSLVLHVIHNGCTIKNFFSIKDKRKLNQPAKDPAFLNAFPTQITVQSGSSAFLSCSVHNLGNHSVSWIRKSDAHILTIGKYTYVKDERFEIIHSDDDTIWTLRIKNFQKQDSGVYECQISTEPKISQFFSLICLVPEVAITNGKELHVQAGSSVQLSCQMRRFIEEPAYVMWYKDGRQLQSDLENNQIEETGINISKRKYDNDTLVVTLSLFKVWTEDGGKYTCKPFNWNPASIVIHVVRGGHLAAVQHENSSSLVIADIYGVMQVLLIICLMKTENYLYEPNLAY